MKTALSLINQVIVRGRGRTGSLRNGTHGIAAGDWEVNAIETLDLDSRIMIYPLDRVVIN